MRYCLPCKAEYARDVKTCPTCGGRTLTPEEHRLWEMAREELSTEAFVEVAVLDGPIEAGLIEGILKEQGIPYVLRTTAGDDISMIFRPAEGWGVLMVLEEDAEQVRRIVKDIREDARRRATEDRPD